MKLVRIEINGLFNTFNHPIDFNVNENITLLLGENGYGKTVILKLIKAVFNKELSYFEEVIFDNFQMFFDDDTHWIIVKSKVKEEVEITLEYYLRNKLKDKISLSDILIDLDNISMYDLERLLPVRRYGHDSWESYDSHEIFTTKALIKKYFKHLPTRFYNKIKSIQTPKWFDEKIEKINVRLIETQRLLILKKEANHQESVEQYSKELFNIIKTKLAESTDLASKLDRTYPNRLAERISQYSPDSVEDADSKLLELEKRRSILDSVGLIDVEKESSIFSLKDTDPQFQQFLKIALLLYIEDSNKKLDIFNDLSLKLSLLLRIINSRFNYKVLRTNKEQGFQVIPKSEHKGDIPLSGLSSGEKHELVLFYELLFHTEPNSLILIDEPEISLHISWQKHFIKDLKEVIKLIGVEIIIATHSPDLIADNWDLTVELVGPENS